MKHDPSEPVIIIPPDTGEQLAIARKNLNLSVQDIAEALKLTENNIIAIENCDYDQLYGSAYATGYVRSYARLVQLDADELVKNDPELGITNNSSQETKSEMHASTFTKSINASWGAILLRATVIATLVIISMAIWTKREDIIDWWQALTLDEPSVQESAPETQSDSNISIQ